MKPSGSLQARLSQDDRRLYNTNRDVAHCFGDMMREVAARLEDERWKDLADLLKREMVGMDELGEACEAYCLFVASSVEDPKETMEEALHRTGWFKMSHTAQVAVMAMLGTVVSGYFFHGVREATLGGEGPASTLQDLRASGSRCSRLLRMSPIRRWWASKVVRLKRILRSNE